MIQRVVIVGAGQTGVSAARALRAEGYAGDITMLAAERHLPYERPPLSKDILTGKVDPGGLALLSEANAADLGIQLLRLTRCVGIDTRTASVETDSGTLLEFDHLILATGGGARELSRLPADGKRVFRLRTIDDALRLRAALLRSRSVLVVGTGWLGLEIASTAREIGLDVHVVENAARVGA